MARAAALAANLLVIPWVSILIGIEGLLYAIGLVDPSAAAPCAASFQFLSRWLTHVVEWMAGIPGASWTW